MRVLILHNRYRQPGGEDAAARREAGMLRQHGWDVLEHVVDNEAANPILGNVALLARSAWSQDSYASVRRICQGFRPAVVHVHNFWMRLTPSVHAAARESGAATVQSLHNYRLVCANGVLLRDGKVCEDCLGRRPWRGVVRRCYRDSLVASAAAARSITHHRRRETWTRDVDAFIVPSESARLKLLHASLPQDRLFVKPNCTADPGQSPSPPSASGSFIFAGRLSPEKGVHVLLSAWARLTQARTMSPEGEPARLIVAGDGPDRAVLEKRAKELGLLPSQVVFAGQVPPSELVKLIQGARAVILPSICLETFGATVIEAFSCGRAAIVSDLGGPSGLVRHGWNGYKVPASNAPALAQSLEAILANESLADQMGRNGRQDYLAEFTPHVNFQTLSGIYDFALRHRHPTPRIGLGPQATDVKQAEEAECRA